MRTDLLPDEDTVEITAVLATCDTATGSQVMVKARARAAEDVVDTFETDGALLARGLLSFSICSVV